MMQNQDQPRQIPKPLIQPQKVLVVDDDAIIRDMMVDMLECEGYSAELARNGQEALHHLRGPQSYLVFLDLLMPVFSGKDVCAQLATQPEIRQRHIIVLMSALDSFAEAGSIGADMVMPKPFLMNDVEEVLKKYM